MAEEKRLRRQATSARECRAGARVSSGGLAHDRPGHPVGADGGDHRQPAADFGESSAAQGEELAREALTLDCAEAVRRLLARGGREKPPPSGHRARGNAAPAHAFHPAALRRIGPGHPAGANGGDQRQPAANFGESSAAQGEALAREALTLDSAEAVRRLLARG